MAVAVSQGHLRLIDTLFPCFRLSSHQDEAVNSLRIARNLCHNTVLREATHILFALDPHRIMSTIGHREG
jgi:hypothetical protein